MKKEFQSGFIAIIGRPNVGKSTLLNALVGEKIAIMSDKPQTTRNKITAVLTEKDYQMIFLDTPGMHRPKSKLGEIMVSEVKSALNEVDAVLLVVEPDQKYGPIEQELLNNLKGLTDRIILIINKIDLVQKNGILPMINDYANLCDFHAVIPVSATNGDGVQIVKDELLKLMPIGPMYFPEDMITDQPEKKMVGEIIREKALQLLDQEVPHGVAVEIVTMKPNEKGLLEITANIYCEKDSHKGIIIGKQGSMLKRIGTMARMDIEKIFGNKIFLELWVKVKPDWRNSEFMLKDFGFKQQ
ncbi:MAG: GTPase Era [Hyphomonadaceae bacterium]|nr:GTPase Era [Clostridia bacterium]